MNVSFVDLGLFLKDSTTLIIGDIHIGYEEALNKQGVMVPRMQFAETMKRFARIVEITKPETIVINGDLKHEFGSISNQEWRDTLKFLSFCEQHSSRVLLVKGNHDTILGPIAEKKNLEIVDYIIIDGTLITHGHKLRDVQEDYGRIVIGHEHPAIGLHSGTRIETYRCFLVGKYDTYELIVMPSFNLVTEGHDILKESRRLSPYLDNIDEFEIYVPQGKELKFFGTVGEMRD